MFFFQNWDPPSLGLGSSKFLVRIQVEDLWYAMYWPLGDDQWLNRISKQYAVYMGPEKTLEKPMEIVKVWAPGT